MKNNPFTLSIKAEATEDGKGRLSRVITFKNGKRVEIPINCNGSIKWFGDSLLIKKQKTNQENSGGDGSAVGDSVRRLPLPENYKYERWYL